MDLTAVKALTFDVFGTVVDWRSGIVREASALGRARGIEADWPAFADAWRALYRPSMDEVRSGRRPWQNLDRLHRDSLERLVADFGLGGFSDADKNQLALAWHRLDPWPDSVPGLTRLKTRFILATLSNGNVALIVNMAKRAGLPWDAVLGAELARHYKPDPETYLTTAELLGLQPAECMMVAAHGGDLAAAAACGFRTAFVPRPAERGPEQTTDLEPGGPVDVIAADFLDLADKLGCA